MNNDIITINNIKIVNNDYILVTVNPKVYSLDIVQSAAYVLMDRAYVIIDGNPEEKILVELKPTDKKENLEKLGRDFNNELLNYAVYKIQAERTKGIREKIVQRALFTNLGEEAGSLLTEENKIPKNSDQDICDVELDEEDTELPKLDNSDTLDYKEDPENIMVPWDEKFSENKEEKRREEK